MPNKEQWNVFYETVGGKYICGGCGAILTWVQQDLAGAVSTKGRVLGLLIAIIATPILGAIYWLYFAPKKGCPICHLKQENIYPLNSKEGRDIFKEKHPEFAHLLPNLITKEQ